VFPREAYPELFFNAVRSTTQEMLVEQQHKANKGQSINDSVQN